MIPAFLRHRLCSCLVHVFNTASTGIGMWKMESRVDLRRCHLVFSLAWGAFPFEASLPVHSYGASA